MVFAALPLHAIMPILKLVKGAVVVVLIAPFRLSQANMSAERRKTSWKRFVLSKPGLSDITQTVEIFNGPSYTTCRGFSIDNVPGGTWKLTIIINSENRSGSTSQEITV